MKQIILSYFLVFITTIIYAQEVITPLHGNQRLTGTNLPTDTKTDATPLLLPFFDDFHTDNIYPDQNLWDGFEGFQNQDFAVFPVSLGVVTLDALDGNGQIHEQAVPGPSTWIADHLTSRAIRLDSIFSPTPKALHASDSIYLSFYFQPGGGLGPHPFSDIGTPPESEDSLVLQFLAPAKGDTIWTKKDTLIDGKKISIPTIKYIEDTWDYVWSAEGLLLDSLITKLEDGSYFMKVMVPITNEVRYFNKNFQFRFINYVSLSSDIIPTWQSNADMWNIDYVYLDTDRRIDEEGFKDLTFVNRGESMLAKYYSMPFNQYIENYVFEMKDSLTNNISNLDTEDYNMEYTYRVHTNVGGLVHEYNGGSFVIKPFSEYGYISHKPFARPPAQFIFPISTADSAEFVITQYLSSDLNLPFKGNDTIVFHQKFHNYYAYDNGTAENGYGVEGDINGKVAIKFKLNKKDTLRGVQIYFNELLSFPSDQSFNITIWNHGDRTPGDIMYQQLEYRPEPTDYMNTFHTFILEEPLEISQENFSNLIFYVGWEKIDDALLNVGFDRSRDSKANSFYNVNGVWYNSLQHGTVMVRPLIGKSLPDDVGFDEYQAQPQISIYPNPMKSNDLFLSVSGLTDYEISTASIKIISLMGNTVFSGTYQYHIVLPNLPAGLYVTQIVTSSGKTFTGKFISTK